MANRVEQGLMLKLVTGMRSKSGFTLVEILVVVLIIGITIGFALLAFGDFGGSRRVVVAAEQFASYTRLVQQQAILEASTLGIRLNQRGYQVFRFNTSGAWQAMSSKTIFHPQHFPDSAVISLENMADKKGSPEIIFNSSGDMTPFKLHFGTEKQRALATVIGSHNGRVSLQLVPST